jgi:hypothetical protein
VLCLLSLHCSKLIHMLCFLSKYRCSLCHILRLSTQHSNRQNYMLCQLIHHNIHLLHDFDIQQGIAVANFHSIVTNKGCLVINTRFSGAYKRVCICNKGSVQLIDQVLNYCIPFNFRFLAKLCNCNYITLLFTNVLSYFCEFVACASWG